MWDVIQLWQWHTSFLKHPSEAAGQLYLFIVGFLDGNQQPTALCSLCAPFALASPTNLQFEKGKGDHNGGPGVVEIGSVLYN